MEQNQYRMYVDGNTVRKAEALPKDDRQERLRREREAQRARNRKIAKRNQARELRMSRRYVAFLAVAVSITCLVCALTGRYYDQNEQYFSIRKRNCRFKDR